MALALNAQGLDEQFSQLDHIAMGLVAAARARLEQLTRTNLAGADVRYAIYGLPPDRNPANTLSGKSPKKVCAAALLCRALAVYPPPPANICRGYLITKVIERRYG